jgi:hypothetical protein
MEPSKSAKKETVTLGICSPKETLKQKIMDEKEKKSRLVRAVFVNPKQPGVAIGPFPLRLYPGKIETYTFVHNEEYTVPEYVIDHINKTVGEAEFHNVVDAKGKLIPKDIRKPRFHFSIVEYL